jgi:hypothetical protein
MSDGGPGPQPFERPRWVLPVALIGAVLIIVGLLLNVASDDGDDDRDVPVVGTTSTLVG